MKGAEGYPPLVVKMISCSDATLMVLYDVFLLHVFSFIIQIMICYMVYIYIRIYIYGHGIYYGLLYYCIYSISYYIRNILKTRDKPCR
jgi:hypothetical protein